MSRGRNSTVVSVRLPDDLIEIIKHRAGGRSVNSMVLDVVKKEFSINKNVKVNIHSLGHDSPCPCGSGKRVRACCGLENLRKMYQ